MNESYWYGKCVILILLIFCGATNCETDPSAQFSQKYVPLSSKEIGKLRAGNFITRLMNTNHSREIYSFGAARMDFPLEYFVEQYLDVKSFKKRFTKCDVGVFGNLPSTKDLVSLSLNEEEFEVLRNCRIGKCKMNLSDSMIERFQLEFKDTKDSRTRIQAVFRELLAEYARDYWLYGASRLIKYHHRKTALILEKELVSLIHSSSYLNEAPSLRKYLESFPAEKPPNTTDFLYWSKEVFGLKPTVTITHVTLYWPEEESGIVWILSRQIFASRYTEGWLTASVLFRENEDPKNPSFYLLFFNKTRSTNFQGAFGSLKRSLVERRVEEKLKMVLLKINSVLSLSYRKEKSMMLK